MTLRATIIEIRYGLVKYHASGLKMCSSKLTRPFPRQLSLQVDLGSQCSIVEAAGARLLNPAAWYSVVRPAIDTACVISSTRQTQDPQCEAPWTWPNGE
jgi:hypothetical protein